MKTAYHELESGFLGMVIGLSPQELIDLMKNGQVAVSVEPPRKNGRILLAAIKELTIVIPLESDTDVTGS